MHLAKKGFNTEKIQQGDFVCFTKDKITRRGIITSISTDTISISGAPMLYVYTIDEIIKGTVYLFVPSSIYSGNNLCIEKDLLIDLDEFNPDLLGKHVLVELHNNAVLVGVVIDVGKILDINYLTVGDESIHSIYVHFDQYKKGIIKITPIT